MIWAAGERGLSLLRFAEPCRQGLLNANQCYAPFDHSAGGSFLGEGAGVCVLKRLQDAHEAGDRIYAVVRGVGSAVRRGSNGTDAQGLTLAMQRAYVSSHVDPGSVSYVEVEAKGVETWDAAELSAIQQVLKPAERDAPLAVGSVKGNIGHSQAAAGLISAMKAALALHQGVLPGTPVGQAAGAALGNGLQLWKETTPFPVANGAPRAAVTTFGPDGSSYHAVLERAPADDGSVEQSTDSGSAEPILIQGNSRAEVRRRIEGLEPEKVGWLASGTIIGRGSVAVGLRSGEGVEQRLRFALKLLDSPAASIATPSRDVAVSDYTLPEETCFLFPGQGSQYPGMMREVAEAYPSAAARLEDIDRVLRKLGRPPLSEILWNDTDKLGEVLWTQLSVLGGDLMMVEVARAHGLRPGMVTGHSYGDYAALVVAGAFDVETVVEGDRAAVRGHYGCRRAGRHGGRLRRQGHGRDAARGRPRLRHPEQHQRAGRDRGLRPAGIHR